MNIDRPSSGDTGDPITQALEHIEKAEHDLEKAHEEEREAQKELREAEHELAEAERRSETEIIVNARPREVPGHTVTFDQVAELAFPGPQPPNTVFSMTYRNAASKPHAGELGPGGVVQVKNGTIFNVTKTVQS